MTDGSPKYLTATEVRFRFGNISDMTLWRWLKDAGMAFPKPVYIRRRRLFVASEIEAWEQAQAETSVAVYSGFRR